jgi:hypothetical protein
MISNIFNIKNSIVITMQRSKNKTINHPSILQNHPCISSSTTHVPSHIALSKNSQPPQSPTAQQSFDFTSYLRQLENGFRQSCRADIVNRRAMIKTIDSKKTNIKSE